MFTDLTAARHALDQLLADLDALERIVPLEQLPEPLRGRIERAIGRAFVAYQRELDALFSAGRSPGPAPAATTPRAPGAPTRSS